MSEFDKHLSALEQWSGATLAAQYRDLLAGQGGEPVGDLVRLYAADELLERNQCYDVLNYCPGFLTIGDDGGGRAVMVHHPLTHKTVYVVDHGSMSEDDFEPVADDVFAWVERGCPLG